MMRQNFDDHVIHILREDPIVIRLAAGGSWIGKQLDEFSDIDLVLITAQRISDYLDTIKK